MPSRRTFIAAGAAVAATANALAPAGAADLDPERAVTPFDLPALMARLNEPAKHKQVFATAHVADGAVLAYVRNSMDAYEKGFGEGPGALRAAVVFYGRGVGLAVNDAAWKKYKVSEALKHAGETIASADQNVNPYWHAPEGENSLEALGSRGTLYLACNNALKGLAHTLALASGSSADDVHADLRKNLIPGAVLVPAGVAAINAAQEARYTFFQASI